MANGWRQMFFFHHELKLFCLLLAAFLAPLPVLPLSVKPSSPTTTTCNQDVERPSRRHLLAATLAYATILTSSSSSSSLLPAIAFGSFPNNNDERFNTRRQVELCLVALQRVAYWADRQATALVTSSIIGGSFSDERRSRELYLESRLGAKAILTCKIGSGATIAAVYTLSTLNLPACLADLEWHANRELSKASAGVVADAKQRFLEGLASIVEFDGLETLTDPSPRTTLTLAQYTNAKAWFVVRAFRELVFPASHQLLHAFGPEPLHKAQRYIEQYYSSEMPPTNETKIINY